MHPKQGTASRRCFVAGSLAAIAVACFVMQPNAHPPPHETPFGSVAFEKHFADFVRILESDPPPARNETSPTTATGHAPAPVPPTAAPVAAGNTGANDEPRLCKTWDALKTGKLAVSQGRAVWKSASHCVVRTTAEIPGSRACRLGKRFAFIGDSLTYSLAKKLRFGTGFLENRTLFKLQGKACPIRLCGCYDQFIPPKDADRNAAFNFYHCASEHNNGSLKHQWVLDDIARADVVVYGGGMWDMGVHFMKGPESFFNTTLDRLTALRALVKPGAQLIVYKLHHIHEKVCAGHRKCKACNSARKAAAFREALEVAAACLGLRVLDTLPMTRPALAATFTHDGIHYTPKFLLASDILANAVCGDSIDLLPLPTTCQPEAALARWKQIPEAHVGCQFTRRQRG
ncbi:hypothetical protein DIPPA_17555 [Diplonema papillatum]|nr:hypothetical protein DIPPA_17555 [Diplonema papillatum]